MRLTTMATKSMMASTSRATTVLHLSTQATVRKTAHPVRIKGAKLAAQKRGSRDKCRADRQWHNPV